MRRWNRQPAARGTGYRLDPVKVRIAASLAVITLAGCSATELTPAGAKVVIRESAGPECRLIRRIQESEGRNFHSAAANVEEVRVELKNRAATLGGDALVLHGPKPEDPIPTRGAPGCPNCIEMSAEVLRCAPPAARPPADQGALGR